MAGQLSKDDELGVDKMATPTGVQVLCLSCCGAVGHHLGDISGSGSSAWREHDDVELVRTSQPNNLVGWMDGLMDGVASVAFDARAECRQ